MRSTAIAVGRLAIALATSLAAPVAAEPGTTPDGAAHASAADRAGEPDEIPEVPRPDFMRNKPYIPELLLRNKREGNYITGMPAIGWDDEEGFALGAFVEFYDNGSRDDPFFRTAPYRRKAFLGAVYATEGPFRMLGRWDQPYIYDSPYRLRVDFMFEHNPINNYFGVGEDSLGKLDFRGYPGNFDTYAEYRDASRRRLPDGTTYAKYNNYSATEYRFEAAVERGSLRGTAPPPRRPQGGLRRRRGLHPRSRRCAWRHGHSAADEVLRGLSVLGWSRAATAAGTTT